MQNNLRLGNLSKDTSSTNMRSLGLQLKKKIKHLSLETVIYANNTESVMNLVLSTEERTSRPYSNMVLKSKLSWRTDVIIVGKSTFLA